MRFLFTALIIAGLAMGTVYEGTTEDLGVQVTAATGSSGSTVDCPDGVITVPSTQPIDCTTLENPNEPPPTGEYVPPVARMLETPPLDEGSSSWGFDWNDDVEVYPGAVGTGQDFDWDENSGDLWACFDTDHATGDSLLVYCSTDGGVTWSLFGVGTNSSGEISNPKIRIVQDNSGTSYVVMMGIWSGGTYSDDLYTRWWTTSGGGGAWALIDSNVDWADMDGDVGAGGYLYATYMPNDTGTLDVYGARNDVDSQTWTDIGSLIVDCQTNPYPAIAAGAGGTVGVVFVDDRQSDMELRVKMSGDYAASWGGSAEVSNTTYDLENPDIAFSRGTPQTGWIFTTYLASTDNFGYYYSTNSGSSWTYGGVISAPGSDDENLGSIRARKSSGSLTVCFNADPGDSTMFTWASPSTPTDFSTPVRVNDFAATGYWPACAGWVNNYSAVLYTDWPNNYRAMFDWFNNTGIDQQNTGVVSLSSAPNPFSSVTNISFSLQQAGPVNISIYDVTGHMVRTLANGESFGAGENSIQWDGRTVSGQMATPGVYFCRLSSNGLSQTTEMLMIR